MFRNVKLRFLELNARTDVVVRRRRKLSCIEPCKHDFVNKNDVKIQTSRTRTVDVYESPIHLYFIYDILVYTLAILVGTFWGSVKTNEKFRLLNVYFFNSMTLNF